MYFYVHFNELFDENTYSKSYDFVPLPLPSRYRYSVTVTHRRPPLRTVHHRCRTLPTVTESYRYLRYKRYQRYQRYINFFNKTLNIQNTLYYDQ